MASTQFKIDFGPAIDKLIKVDKMIYRRAIQGVGRAMLQLRTDMIMQTPTAPIKEGFLRGSTSIFVQNVEVETPPMPNEKTDKKVKSFSMKIKKTQIVGVIGVNVPYAARWHEVPANFSEPTAGNKYLESKMANNKFTYKKIIANTIQKPGRV